MKLLLSICMSICLSISMCLASAMAEEGAYQLPITRDGETTTRVAYHFWSGEYPGPVIDVSSKNAGTTTVEAYESVRDLSGKMSCTIKNGIYHPWSTTGSSVVHFFSLIHVIQFKALKDTQLGTLNVKKGSLITNVLSYGEGVCAGTLVQDGKQEEFDFDCSEIQSPQAFQDLSDQDEFSEQWLYVACAEGKKGYVQDKTLLAHPGVKEGTFLEYGEVGPAEE